MSSLFIRFCGFLLALVFFSGNITADEATDIYDLSLSELLKLKVKSSNKVDTEVKGIAANVTIVTRSEIERYGYVTLEEIIKNMPGMTFIDNTEELLIGVRGTTGGGIQFLLNGIPHHPSLQKGLDVTDISQFNVPVGSIDRIEFTRGPMSVIYGNNAFFGVVNIITNDVNRQKSVVSISAGDQNSLAFARYANDFEEGYIAVNFGTYHTDGLSADYADMLSEQQLAMLHPEVGQSMAGNAEHERINLDVTGQYKNWHASFRVSDMEYGFYPTTPGFNLSNDIQLHTVHASLSNESNLSENTLLRITGIMSEETYEIPHLSLITPTLDGSQDKESRRSELEINLVHDKNQLQWIGGYRYRNIDNIQRAVSVSVGPVMIRNEIDTMSDSTTQDAFAQVSSRLDPNWSFTAGLRFSRLPEDYIRTRQDKTGDTVTREIVKVDDRNLFTGRLGLIYDINSYHQMKFMLGTAAQDRDEFEVSDPEEIETYEVNYSYTKDKIRLASNIFFNEINGIVQRDLSIDMNNNVIIDVNNFGQWKTYGTELIAEYRFDNNIRLSGSSTYQETKDDAAHIEVGYSPDLIGKVKLDYVRGAFSAALNWYYVGAMNTSYLLADDDMNASTPEVPERLGDKVASYSILSANLRYQSNNGIFLNLNGNNLLDKTYRYPANSVATMKHGLIGMGRVITLTLGYQF